LSVFCLSFIFQVTSFDGVFDLETFHCIAFILSAIVFFFW